MFVSAVFVPPSNKEARLMVYLESVVISAIENGGWLRCEPSRRCCQEPPD